MYLVAIILIILVIFLWFFSNYIFITNKEYFNVNSPVLDKIVKQDWVSGELKATNKFLTSKGLVSLSMSNPIIMKMIHNLKIWFSQPTSKKNKMLRYLVVDEKEKAKIYNDAEHIWSEMLKETYQYMSAFRLKEDYFQKIFKSYEPDFNEKLKKGDTNTKRFVYDSLKGLTDVYINSRAKHPNENIKQRNSYALKELPAIVKKHHKKTRPPRKKHDAPHKSKTEKPGLIDKNMWKKDCKNEDFAECMKNKIISYSKNAKNVENNISNLKSFLKEIKEDPIFAKFTHDIKIKTPEIKTKEISKKLSPLISWATKENSTIKNLTESILGPAAVELGAGVGELLGGPIGAFLVKKVLTGTKTGARYLYNMYLIRQKEKSAGVNNIGDLLKKIFKEVKDKKMSIDKALDVVIQVLKYPPIEFPDIFHSKDVMKQEKNWDIFSSLVSNCGKDIRDHEKKIKTIIEKMGKGTFSHATHNQIDKAMPQKDFAILHTYIHNTYPDLTQFLPHGYPTSYKKCLVQLDDIKKKEKKNEKFTDYKDYVNFIPDGFLDDISITRY